MDSIHRHAGQLRMPGIVSAALNRVMLVPHLQPYLMMSDIKKLLKKHGKLNHLENVKVESHVQRNTDDWVINTIMLEGYEVPFKYKRAKAYKNLKGGRVNLTFYAETESVAGMAFEVMNVVRIRRS